MTQWVENFISGSKSLYIRLRGRKNHMIQKVQILPKVAFARGLRNLGVSQENVEEHDAMAFISILDRGYDGHFSENADNVLIQTFGDVDFDIGKCKAMTQSQAEEMWEFIWRHRDRNFVVHCTAGISRSGAVGTFITDYFGEDWEAFKRANPHILPNQHVLKLLREASEGGNND